MPRLNQRGTAHLLVPLILLVGIIAGVYLVKSGNLKLFSRAANPPIVFKSTDGKALPLNSNGIPQSTSPTVMVELTSTLGPPASLSSPISGPNGTGTVSYRAGFSPTDLDIATFVPYTTEPTVYNVGFKKTPGVQFYWVEFKSADGKTDRRSTQIELVAPNPKPSPSGGTTNSFGKAAKFNNDTSNNAYATVTTTSLASGNPFTVEAWVKVYKPISGNYIRDYSILTYTNPQLPFIASGYIFRLSSEVQETSGTSRPRFQALLDKWTDIQNGHLAYISVGQGIGGDTTLQPNRWYHIAVTSQSDITKCFMKMYVNGILTASEERFGPVGPGGNCQISTNSPQQLLLAKPGSSSGGISGYYYNGEIDELRISNIIRYTRNFTPTKDPFSSDSNTLTLYHFDGDVNDSSGNNNNGQIYGNVQFVNSTIGRVSPTPTPTLTPTPTPSPTPTPTTTPSPVASSKRVFVTSTQYNGNLGGLTGADAKCQDRANSANLGGTWKAWLSSDTISVSSRLSHNDGPYKRIDGVLVANNWSDLTDGSLLASLNVTEIKTTNNASWVWTNSFSNGAIRQSANGSCINWTSGSGISDGGDTGDSTRVDSGWSDYGASACNYNRPVYCFEQ